MILEEPEDNNEGIAPAETKSGKYKRINGPEIARRYGLTSAQIHAYAYEYGWSQARSGFTGWRVMYREDHVQRTMDKLGIQEIHEQNPK